MSDAIESRDSIELRKVIVRTVRESDDAPARADVLDTVSSTVGVTVDAVAAELAVLERYSIVQYVGDAPEVRMS